MLISQLNEEIVELKNGGQKTKKLEVKFALYNPPQIISQEQLSKKEEEIKSLKDDLETMNSIIVESKDQKEDELKLASAALQELAVRYIEVEKQLLALRGDGDIKPTHSSSASVSNKPRK